MDTSDFLQANDINKIFLTVDAISRGLRTDDEIELVINVDSEGRQARYYRLAAQKLGWVTDNSPYSLTNAGGILQAATSTTQKYQCLAQRLRVTPVFSEAITFLAQTPPPTSQQLEAWFISNYPGAESTAERRFSAFTNYLRATGFI